MNRSLVVLLTVFALFVLGYLANTLSSSVHAGPPAPAPAQPDAGHDS